MEHKILNSKPARLLLILGTFFVCNALIAEFIGVKIFSLENTFGWKAFNWNLFGQKGTLNFTVGVILWPIVFIMTDIMNEYFGRRGVRQLSFIAAILILYAFGIVYLAIEMAPAEFWPSSMSEYGVENMQTAYSAVFGQGMWIIGGSLTAFIFSQLIDVSLFHKIKFITGEKRIWLRATGSTVFSQIFDSLIVLYIAFVLGPQKWSMSLFLAVATVNYVYKVCAAILLTPFLYIIHNRIDKFLGEELSLKMRQEAMLK